eukprot:3295518-Amphidinium_carterae.3
MHVSRVYATLYEGAALREPPPTLYTSGASKGRKRLVQHECSPVPAPSGRRRPVMCTSCTTDARGVGTYAGLWLWEQTGNEHRTNFVNNLESIYLIVLPYGLDCDGAKRQVGQLRNSVKHGSKALRTLRRGEAGCYWNNREVASHEVEQPRGR